MAIPPLRAPLRQHMLAQAEHDVDASAILLTTSKRLALAVASEVERQLRTLPTAAVAAKSIARNSAIILIRSVEEALEISNRFAPEHLSIPDASLLPGVLHAGSVFVGPYSPERPAITHRAPITSSRQAARPASAAASPSPTTSR